MLLIMMTKIVMMTTINFDDDVDAVVVRRPSSVVCRPRRRPCRPGRRSVMGVVALCGFRLQCMLRFLDSWRVKWEGSLVRLTWFGYCY